MVVGKVAVKITADAPLGERLALHFRGHNKSVDPHEVATELAQLYNHYDLEGVRKLRDVYLIGLGRNFPRKKSNELRQRVDSNLLSAANLADLVAACGYERSGQLLLAVPFFNGLVSQFYQEATGYRPKDTKE